MYKISIGQLVTIGISGLLGWYFLAFSTKKINMSKKMSKARARAEEQRKKCANCKVCHGRGSIGNLWPPEVCQACGGFAGEIFDSLDEAIDNLLP